MNKPLTILFSLFISISTFAKSGKISLSGEVINPSVTTIKITDFKYKALASAELDDTGSFKMSTKLEDGFYLLNYGRNTAYVYLYPKDELSVSFDANHFDETLTFSGQGAERNNYLAKKSVLDQQLTEDLEAFYKVDETTYMANIADVKSKHLAELQKYSVASFFKTAEEKSLEYDRLLSIQNYASSYKFYLGEEITPSEEFYASLKHLNLTNEEDFKKQPYYRYLVNSIWSKRIEEAPGVEGMLNVFRGIKSRPIFISLANGLYSKISSKNERAKDYLDLVKRLTTHQPFIDACEKRYEEVMNAKRLAKGDASPGFSYESVDGKTISLSDLKGKYVYIDVWATWCGPCIKQVPYLKALEERYHDEAIVFVSISVDKEKVKNTWKQFIADKQLGGLQLFADKSFESDFMNAYAINSIPRFILIDPEGKIVDPEAPRPSFEKTKVLLDGLLKH